MISHYDSMLDRIERVETREQLEKLERSFERLWDAGVFTRKEFYRLDSLLMEKGDSLK